MEIPAHLTDHTSAEACALDLALGMQRLGALLTCLEQHLGESVIFDPQADLKEKTFRDGIRVGRMLSRFLVEAAIKQGIDPGKVGDRWTLLVEAAMTQAAKEKRC